MIEAQEVPPEEPDPGIDPGTEIDPEQPGESGQWYTG